MGRIKIVRASAGSGKTYRLSYEYVRRALGAPELYRHILAVTFTNKATDEMKSRIVREINDLANGHTSSGTPPAFAAELQKELNISPDELRERATRLRSRILHDYSRFTVLTIDKFFQRIIRAFLRELGVESDFTLELQTESVLGAAADRLIEETLSDRGLRDWIGHYIAERINEGRGWDIRRELTTLGREIFSEEYKKQDTSPRSRGEMQKIVAEAVAQTEKAKARMVESAQQAITLLTANGLTREDFPYGKSGFAGYFYTVATGDVWAGYGKRVADALESDEKWYTKSSPRKSDLQNITPALKPILSTICALYDQHRGFALTTGLIRENFRAFGLLNDLAEQVRSACGERNVMPISETNRLIDRLIAGNDTPFIFEKAGNHFSHFLIDEFQDTSAAQWDNFRPLLHNALSQSDKDPVLLVGDVKQSIYRWRGGDWEILGDGVDRTFAGSETLSLDHNWRSAGNIVRFNNEMIGAAVATAGAELDASVDEAAQAGTIDAPLRERLHGMTARAYTDLNQKIALRSTEDKGYIKITQYARDEAGRREDALIETIESLQHRGFRAADIAILVRRNAEAVEMANYLLEYKSAYPDSPFCYDVVTREALVIGRAPVIGFVTACFRLAVNPDDSIPRAVFLRWLGRAVDSELTADEKAFLGSLRRQSPEEAFEQILLTHRPDRRPGGTAYLQAFHDQLISFGGSRIADLPLFLKWWDETGSAESIDLPSGQNAITILTIHKSKGLEFPAVIMPCATWEMTPGLRTLLWTQAPGAPFDRLGTMPVRFRKEMAGSAFAPDYFRETVYAAVDNLNLLYVALTRAREELHLMMPRVKEPRGSRVSDLLLRSLRTEGPTVHAGAFAGTATDDGSDLTFEWGRPVEHPAPAAVPEKAVEEYPVFRFTGKLRLRREAERYRDEATGQWRLSPRQYGRLMHRVFESVSTADEVDGVLDRFEAEGTLSSDDRADLAAAIAGAFADPQVRGWFDGSWTQVRNESDIIVPAASASLRRPDRVMIREGRVVVVDYKFGQKEQKAHARQVGEYMGLIRKMGYPQVEGYIWYVETGKVVPATFS
jgi:ATP-dependent exoDNAse (exonuclease V) beta subunit